MSFFDQTMSRIKPVAQGIKRAMSAAGRALFRGAKGAGRALVSFSKLVGRTVVKGSKSVGHTVVRMMRIAAGKTGDTLEMRRLKSRIKKSRTKAAACKSDIGKYYWDKCKSGAMSWDEAIDGVCRALRASEGDIAACEAQILNLREKIYGPDGRVCVDDVEEFEGFEKVEFERGAEGCRREKAEIEEYVDEEYGIEEDKDEGYSDQWHGAERYEVIDDREKYGDEADAVPSFIQFRTPSDTQIVNDAGEEPVAVSHVKAHKVSRKDNRGFWEGEEGPAEISTEFIPLTENPEGEEVSRYRKLEYDALGLEDFYEPHREKGIPDDVFAERWINGNKEELYCEFCGYANAPGVDVCERCGALVS